MKRSFLFISLCLIGLVTSAIQITTNLDNQQEISSAISSAIRDHFDQNSIRFDVRIYEQEKSSELREIVTKTLQSTGGKYGTSSGCEFKVVKVKDDHTEEEKKQFWLKISAILFFDSLETLKLFIRRVELKNNEGKIDFLVYYPNAKQKEVLDLFPSFDPTGFQLFTSFLFGEGDDGYLNLAVISYFGSQPCRQPKVQTINKFSVKYTIWISTTFSPRATNFYGCNIVFETPRQEKVSRENQFKIDVVEAIGSKLNFKPLFVDSSMKSIRVDMELKLLKPLMNKLVDEEFMTILSNYEVFFLIPPGKLYTDQEKTFLKYDVITAILFIVSFFAAGAIILLINSCATENKINFCFMLRCISKLVLPSRKHGRYVLMILILFCLILRTTYQRMQISFTINKEIRKSSVKSIEEMVQNNFSIFIPETLWKDYGNFPRSVPVEVDTTEKFLSIADYITNSNSSALLLTSNFVQEEAAKHRRFTFLKHKIMPVHTSLVFPRNHFLYEPFNEKIDAMKDVGIINFLDKTQLTDVQEYQSSSLNTVKKLWGIYITLTAFAFFGLWFEIFTLWMPINLENSIIEE